MATLVEFVMHVDGYVSSQHVILLLIKGQPWPSIAILWLNGYNQTCTHTSTPTPSPMHTHLHNHHLLLAALLVTTAHTKAQLRGENVTYCPLLARFHRTELC